MGQSGAIRCNFNGSASIWAPSGPISCESAMRSLRLYLVICSYGSAHFCAGVALDPYILIVVASVSGSVLSQRSVVLWSFAFLRPPLASRLPRTKMKTPCSLSISFYGTPRRCWKRHINPETLGHGPNWGDPM